MLNPLLHFHFQNLSIISIVSPIFIQPSVFIIVLHTFPTLLTYPFPYLNPPVFTYKNNKSYKKERHSYSPLSSVSASDRLSSLHFSVFSLGFLFPAVPAIIQHYSHLYSQQFTKCFILFHLFPVQIHPPHHFSVLCPYLVIFPPALHCLPTPSSPDTITRFR